MNADAPRTLAVVRRLGLTVGGVVQGVGFRPFVKRAALQHGLSGKVANHSHGVEIQIEGEEPRLQGFVAALKNNLPAGARIDTLDISYLTPIADKGFIIACSVKNVQTAVTIPHDLAPCPRCLEEFNNPEDRRFRYAFISCTVCGPRWSVLEHLPFDRENTSFAAFTRCADCDAEYRDINQRRYHHQAISCPRCGPRLKLRDSSGGAIGEGNETEEHRKWQVVVEALQQGEIVALKSVGGFQLLVDGTNARAIERLRQRKGRPTKPLAVLFPDTEQLLEHCHADSDEQSAVASEIRPIVLLGSKKTLPEVIAPRASLIGAMLPPSALHEALLALWRKPLVATSGNRSGDPLCFDNDDALRRLGDIADLFLLHDLHVTRPLDDSLVRVIDSRPVTFRAGRGLAPTLIPQKQAAGAGMLATGGHLKNTVAVATSQGILASAHIGNLDSQMVQKRFVETIEGLKPFVTDHGSVAVTDLHPDYGSSRWASESGRTCQQVQHHIAHFFSVMAEHNYCGPALGVCWDGNGLGSDGNMWGGEFFVWDGAQDVKRVAHLRPFPLPGGEAAIREPRRQALGLLAAMGAELPARLRTAFTESEIYNLGIMLEKNLNTPLTTSAGRLIDAVAALLDICHIQRYEADAAMQLEALAEQPGADGFELPFEIKLHGDCLIIDWQPLVLTLLEYKDRGSPNRALAAAFHRAMVAIITAVAKEFGTLPVFLSGGVFQNKMLTECAVQNLELDGRKVYTHGRIPPNDGGLAVGQLNYALHCVDPGNKGAGRCV